TKDIGVCDSLRSEESQTERETLEFAIRSSGSFYTLYKGAAEEGEERADRSRERVRDLRPAAQLGDGEAGRRGDLAHRRLVDGGGLRGPRGERRAVEGAGGNPCRGRVKP